MLTPSLISTFPGSQLVSVSQLMQPEIHWLRHASGRAVPLQDGLRRLSDWWQLRMVTVCHGIGIWRKTVKHHDNDISIFQAFQAYYIGPANPKNWKECPGRFLWCWKRSKQNRAPSRSQVWKNQLLLWRLLAADCSCCDKAAAGWCFQHDSAVFFCVFANHQTRFNGFHMDFIWISYGFHMDFIGPAILWFLWSTRSFQQVTTWGRSTEAWRDPDPHRLFSLSAASLCCFDALPRELCQYLDLPCKIGHQFGLSSTDQWVSSWEAESSVCLDSSGSEQRHRCLIAWIHLYSTVFIVFSIFLAISVTSCCGCKMLKQEITKHFEHLWTNCVKRCEELKLPRFEVMSTSISVATSQTRSCKSYQFLVFVMSFFTKLFEIIRSHLHFIFFPSVRSFQGRLAHRR